MYDVGRPQLIGGKLPNSKSHFFPVNPSFRYSKKTIRKPSGRPSLPKTVALLGIGTLQSDTLSLPIDFYALLQISRGVSRDSVSRAYEKYVYHHLISKSTPTSDRSLIFHSYRCRCLANPPNVGYSPQALNAREVVLRGALETLASPATRRQYDERLSLGAYTEEVPGDFIAGTLLLLQEAGDHQTVIASGESWLATHRRHRSARDVALATALAHCDVAQMRVDAHGSTQQAAAMFELALKLLRDYRAGTQELSKKIESALKDLQPRLAIELLSDASPALRARGKAILPTALAFLSERAQDSRRDESTRRQYLDALRNVLTAKEQTELYNAAGKTYAHSPAELYNCAIAHIAAGCSAGDASLIQTAAELLEKAEEIAHEIQAACAIEESKAVVRDRRSLEESQRRAVAACVAALLLGDSSAAGAALGLSDGRLKCDRQVLAFIKASSPDGQNLLPGVCALVTRWVSDVALASFKTDDERNENKNVDNAVEFSLDAWFDNPAVAKYLEARGMRSDRNSAGGTNIFKDIFKSVVFGLSGLFTVTAAPSIAVNAGDDSQVTVVDTIVEEKELSQEMEKAASAPVPASSAPASSAVAAVGEEKRPVVVVKKVEEPVAAAVSDAPPAASTPTPKEQTLTTTTTIDNSTRTALPLITSTPATPAIADLQNEDDEFLTQPVALEAIKPLHGEDDWMRNAYEARQIRWGRLFAAVAVVIGGTSLAAVRAGVPSILAGSTTAPSMITSLPTSTVVQPSSSAVSMSKGDAASLIQRWQRIKANALGPRHSSEALSSVLQGDVLQQWKERASLVASRGWYYSHDLQSCKILDVRPSSVIANGVTVTANFREGVTVHKADGSEPQTFVSDYQVVYEVVKGVNGWVISNARVQASAS